MEQRLLSRFKWGLSADLQSPGLETRLAILMKKIKKDGIDIPYEVIEYIAYSITSNVRELEGALISLLAQSSFYNYHKQLNQAVKLLNGIENIKLINTNFIIPMPKKNSFRMSKKLSLPSRCFPDSYRFVF